MLVCQQGKPRALSPGGHREDSLLTWNFRGGPSGWILELMTSATIMPKRRTGGKLLSRRHFTPAIMLASNS